MYALFHIIVNLPYHCTLISILLNWFCYWKTKTLKNKVYISKININILLHLYLFGVLNTLEEIVGEVFVHITDYIRLLFIDLPSIIIALGVNGNVEFKHTNKDANMIIICMFCREMNI